MSLLPKSIHRCRRYPTKFNSGRDIPRRSVPSPYRIFDDGSRFAGLSREHGNVGTGSRHYCEHDISTRQDVGKAVRHLALVCR